jgi:hypothetical protein
VGGQHGASPVRSTVQYCRLGMSVGVVPAVTVHHGGVVVVGEGCVISCHTTGWLVRYFFQAGSLYCTILQVGHV